MEWGKRHGKCSTSVSRQMAKASDDGLIVWAQARTEQRNDEISLDAKHQDAFMRCPLLLFAAAGSLKLEPPSVEQLPYVLTS